METKTHWKVYQDNNTVGAWMFEDQDKVLTIKNITYEDFTASDGKKSKKRICHFEEIDKPLVVNSTNAATISTIYHTPYMEKWVGKKIQLYKDTIRAFGENKDCVRIRKWNPCICAECKKEIESYNNMTAEQLAVYTSSKYKKPLCSGCATKMKDGT